MTLDVGSGRRAAESVDVDSLLATTITIGEVVNEDLANGSVEDFFRGTDGTDDFVVEGAQPTNDVSTSAKTIYTSQELGSFVVVVGQDTTDSTTHFCELVVFSNGGSATAVASSDRGTPAGRTYSVDSFADLQLAMASGTYDVMAKAVELDPSHVT